MEGALKMKRIRLLMILAVILCIVGWVVLKFLVGSIEGYPRSHEDIKKQAEAGIKEVGGTDILEKEATSILNNFRAGSNQTWQSISANGNNCPTITKLYALLSPYGPGLWVVEDNKNLPAHIVIRLGSHAYYEYMWIFDPKHIPLVKIKSVEHLGGAVYLSEKNE